MRIIETFQVSYVTPESADEEAELLNLIDAVRQERLGIDFAAEDLKPVQPEIAPGGGIFKEHH